MAEYELQNVSTVPWNRTRLTRSCSSRGRVARSTVRLRTSVWGWRLYGAAGRWTVSSAPTPGQRRTNAARPDDLATSSEHTPDRPPTDNTSCHSPAQHNATTKHVRKAPFTRYNRFDNWLYHVYKHSTGCQTVSVEPVVKTVWQAVWQPVGCLFTRYSRLWNRLYNRFDNRLLRVNGV